MIKLNILLACAKSLIYIYIYIYIFNQQNVISVEAFDTVGRLLESVKVSSPLPFFDIFHFPGVRMLRRQAIRPIVDTPNHVPPSRPGCMSRPTWDRRLNCVIVGFLMRAYFMIRVNSIHKHVRIPNTRPCL